MKTKEQYFLLFNYLKIQIKTLYIFALFIRFHILHALELDNDDDREEFYAYQSQVRDEALRHNREVERVFQEKRERNAAEFKERA